MLRIQETYNILKIIPTGHQKHLFKINSSQFLAKMSLDWEMFILIY